MFGYVKPYIPELKVKENELYKATYCGLCRTMGKTTGCLSKLILNYDFTYLALVRYALEGGRATVRMRRCPVHPFKKRPMLEPDDTLRYCAKASVILTRLKLQDNVNDSHGIARLKARIAKLICLFLKKTDKDHAPLEKKVGELIEELTAMEKQKCDSIDTVADIFGKILAEIASFGLEGVNKRIAEDIGIHLGKWIYVMDACDDFESDRKSGSYNPLICAFGDTLTDENKYALRCGAMMELMALSNSAELIDYSDHSDVEGIIKNTLHLGMVAETDRVLDFKPVEETDATVN
ncbi:MAG: hypothetical protein IJX51_08970 [Clostridia bacterium]|nr:hypothetical protein [Clostridia bacterium]